MPVKGAREFCHGQTKDGRTCQNPAHRAGLCYLHWAKENGSKTPQDYRRKNAKGSADKLLPLMGMDAKAVNKLRKLFPEITNTELDQVTPHALLEAVQKALALRALADASPNTMKALILLSEHLEKPDSSKMDEFVDLWSNAY